jgi:putative acetyltransferase
VADAILRQIEDQARDLGLPALRLETAETLAAALRIYERHGFKRRGIFGTYAPNETSVFMEKPLG